MDVDDNPIQFHVRLQIRIEFAFPHKGKVRLMVHSLINQ
jgi:hypothetical protein